MARRSGWKLKRTTQCAKCPWLKDVDPRDIPNGYNEGKHCALKSTIVSPGDLRGIHDPELKVMACHETHDAHCIGWLMNQVGPGNNIGLRLRMMSCKNRDKIKVVGDQHETFEATLPSCGCGIPISAAKVCRDCNTVTGSKECPVCGYSTMTHPESDNQQGYCGDCADEFDSKDLVVIRYEDDPYSQMDDGMLYTVCRPCAKKRVNE